MASPESIPASKSASCSVCGRAVWKSATSADVQRCRECIASSPSHGASRYRQGCRCDECRAGAAARMREYSARRRAEGRPLPKSRVRVQRACQVCLAPFSVPTYATTRFCSSACVGVSKRIDPARLRRVRGSKRSPTVARALRLAASSAIGSSGGGRVWVQGKCIVCSDQYLSPGAASRYCSKKCRAINRRRSFGLSWLDRMALFARDGWACQICSEPVDYLADPHSDWYPSLDHIVPRSRGGSDDVSNLRLAHRWCNSVRGDLSFYSDDDLAVPA